MKKSLPVILGFFCSGVSLTMSAQAIRLKTTEYPNKTVHSTNGISPGPAYFSEVTFEKSECISDETRAEVRSAIAVNKEEILKIRPHAFDYAKSDHPLFIWPTQAKEGFDDYGYYTVNFLVDHNNTNNTFLDYNCGSRSYDWVGGNHEGTDIILWPYPWKRMQEEVMEIVAAAPGIIIDKRDGNYDLNCSNNGNVNWNGVVIQHQDGSEAWYWHFKDGAITTKEIGESVEAGEYLGAAGSSGSSNWPHLHFEIYDAEGNLIDPWQGECNSMNDDSWWEDQQDYFEPAVNRISTHHTAELIIDCPNPEETNEAYNFNDGDSLFLRLFLKDLQDGVVTDLTIFGPDDQVFVSWSWENDWGQDYATADVFWYYVISSSWPEGDYIFQAGFDGDIYQTGFGVGTSVGTKDETKGEPSVFPNPANTSLYITGMGNALYKHISVYDITGQNVYSSQVLNDDQTIPTASFPSGIYLLQLSHDNGQSSIKKFVVNH